jgi:hypothetical protein
MPANDAVTIGKVTTTAKVASFKKKSFDEGHKQGHANKELDGALRFPVGSRSCIAVKKRIPILERATNSQLGASTQIIEIQTLQ